MTSKAYKQGCQKGYLDAKSGKGKNFRGMAKGVLSFNFKNYSKQYTLGYNEGYRIGMRKTTK